jgi:hypothetical protein
VLRALYDHAQQRLMKACVRTETWSMEPHCSVVCVLCVVCCVCVAYVRSRTLKKGP